MVKERCRPINEEGKDLKKLLTLALVALSVVGISACGAQEQTIGFAASTFTNPFFLDIEEGIESVLEGTDYTLVSLGADNDAARQASQIEDLIAQGVDLILLNPVDSTTVGVKIQEANDAGIPVITVDRSAETGTVVAHVASDNVLGGEMAAEFLQGICPPNTPVLELTGQAGASAAIDRSEGFQAVFGASNITQTTTASWSRSDAQTVTEAFLSANGNPAAVCIFAANDEMALGAVEAVKANPTTQLADSYIVGFDAIDDAVNAVNAGELRATVAQQPFEIGAVAAQTGLDYLAGQSVAANIPVELALVTKES